MNSFIGFVLVACLIVLITARTPFYHAQEFLMGARATVRGLLIFTGDAWRNWPDYYLEGRRQVYHELSSRNLIEKEVDME